jgi:hypothetical protein
MKKISQSALPTQAGRTDLYQLHNPQALAPSWKYLIRTASRKDMKCAPKENPNIGNVEFDIARESTSLRLRSIYTTLD